MKTGGKKILIGSGIFCVLATLLSSWYAVRYNGARLVAPMDFGSYVFQVRDLPMILSVTLDGVYVFALVAAALAAGCRQARQVRKSNTTRRIDPRLGLLGFLGFLGFTGFWTYRVDGSVFPFVFFLFFGFFGFYYESKLSGTFMDERFRENAARAQLAAFKTTFAMAFLTLIVLCQGRLMDDLEYTLIAVIILLSLTLALGMFLSEYLLYKYDHDDQPDESGE